MSQFSCSLCICTYQRPESLSGLLEAIARQDSFPGEFEVVIADNDVHQSARWVVNARYPFAIQYVREPVQNISLARNAAALAAKYETLIFLDDDQSVDRDFLTDVQSEWRRLNSAADVIMFSKSGRFEDTAESVVRIADPFSTTYLSEGAISGNWVATSGVLLPRKIFCQDRIFFDSTWGRMRGEDNEFFHRVEKAGYRSYFTRRVRTFEIATGERGTAVYFVTLALQTGYCYSLIQYHAGHVPERMAYSLKTACDFLAACVLAMVRWPLGPVAQFRSRLLLARQVGKMKGLRDSLFPQEQPLSLSV